MKLIAVILLDIFIVGQCSSPEDALESPSISAVDVPHVMLQPRPVSPNVYVGSLNGVRDVQLAHDTNLGFLFPARLEQSILEESPVGPLTLGGSIYRTRYSTVFELDSHPEWVIKYQIETEDDYTDELSRPLSTTKDSILHPLFRDFYFQEIASRLSISPVLHFISGPTELGSSGECGPKCDFDVDVDTKESYHQHGYVVRYMVMDMLVRPLVQLILWSGNPRRVPLHEGIAIGKQMIRILQKLHDEAGIVHGDIHAGNFMFTEDNQLRLIDFGRAFFETDIAVFVAMGESEPFLEGNNYSVLSPWEMNGFMQGKRDDVFKAILTFAQIVVGSELLDHLDSNILKPNICMHLKTSGDMFFYPFVNANPLTNLRIEDPATEAKIRSSFREIALLAVAPRNIQDRPRYGEILEQMDAILELIKPSR